MSTAIPPIDWTVSDHPLAPMELLDSNPVPYVLMMTQVPLPIQPASGLVPDPAVGYPLSG